MREEALLTALLIFSFIAGIIVLLFLVYQIALVLSGTTSK